MLSKTNSTAFAFNQKVLFLAQNSVQILPNLENLRNPDSDLQGVILVEDLATEKPIITVGYHNNTALMTSDKSYSAKGYGYDLLTKLGRHANIEFKFVEIEGSLIDAVQNGLADISGIYSKTPERVEQIYFSSIPVNNYQFALSVRGDGKNYFYDNPTAISGKTVATYLGNPANYLFEKYLLNNNISVNYVYGSIRGYTNLEAEYFLTSSALAADRNLSSVLNLSIDNGYFFTRIGNEKLINFLDKKLYQLFVNNGSLHYDLIRKYQPIERQYRNRDLSPLEAGKLRGRTFKVGYTDNHPPYQSQNFMGEPSGISIEILDLLAEKYEFNLEYIPYHPDDNSAIFSDFDLLISLVGDRSEVSKYFDKTDPYQALDMNLIMQEELMQNLQTNIWDYNLPKNKKVGILNYLTFEYDKFFRRNPSANLTRYTKTEDLLNAFKNKNLDAIIVTSLGGDTVASSSTIKAGRQQISLDLPMDLEINISKKLSNEYLEIFNTMINKISPSTINDIMVNELAKYAPQYGIQQLLKEYFYFILFILLGFVGTIIGLVVTIRQRSAINVLGKDEITQLSSMSKFASDVDAVLAKAKPHEYEMILLDIDFFRMINNYYGQSKGTEVIQAMANALADAYRDTNALMTRRVAEQFIIFKKKTEGKKIQEVINAYVIPQVKAILGENYSLNMSVGYCLNKERNEKMHTLLDYANTAQQQAKKTHDTSFQEFTEEMRAQSTKMLDIIYRMEHALRNKEFQIHYQPKIQFDNFKIIGAEALPRWIPPIGPIIYPGDFIPIMEKNDFISQLELYVFEEVCTFIQNNPQMHIPKIAVNLSAITLSNATTIKQLVEILKENKVHPSKIEVEITEFAIEKFEEALPTIIKILHKIGFTVAMDDFGAGNSSFTRLSGLEVDVLKLDKIFLNSHENSTRGSLVVQKIIHLAKELGMQVVAKGVETKEQAKWLQEAGCDMAQGYYFAEALDEGIFLKLMREDKQYYLK